MDKPHYKAIQLSAYGGVDQLKIVDLIKPLPKTDEVVVRVIAAGINPGEISIREGLLQNMFPKAFPFGQGTDFAGEITSVGSGVRTFAVGDAVLGWSDERSAHAEYVVSPTDHLIMKPPALDWFRAGSLFVAGTTAFASVRAVALQLGDVIAISAAAGGVGSLAVQLAKATGARVIGIASEKNIDFLKSLGAEPVTHGDGLEARLRALAPDGITAFIDLYGEGYVELALALGVEKTRINTIIDFAAVQKHGIKADGSAAASDTDTLSLLANMVAWGELKMPLAAIYPFAAIHDAYIDLAKRQSRGKLVLAMDTSITQVLRPSLT